MTTKLNQRGQVLLGAIIVSVAFITAFAGFQLYIRNLEKVYIRYKEATNLMDAVDKASGDIRAAWGRAATTAWGNAGKPLSSSPQYPTPQAINNLMAANMPPLDPSCSVGAGCVGANCCPTTAILCYSNPTNPAFPYCFFNSTFGGGAKNPTASFDFRLVIPGEKKSSAMEGYKDKVGEVIASLVHKIRGHGFIENKVLATPTIIVPRTDNIGTISAGATKITCGLSGGAPLNQGPCATIYACPSAYPQCSTFNANPIAAKAVFIQQFSLTPSGGS